MSTVGVFKGIYYGFGCLVGAHCEAKLPCEESIALVHVDASARNTNIRSSLKNRLTGMRGQTVL